MSQRFLQICGLLCFATLSGCDEKSAVGTAPGSLEGAWQQFGFGAFDASISTFQEIAGKASPSNPNRAQALYGEATVWDLRRPGNSAEKAAELYQSVINSAPDTDSAAWSALALVRQKVILPVGQKPDWESVRMEYQAVIDHYPDRMAAEEASLLLQASLLETFRPADAQSALETLQKFTITNPDSYYLSAAHSLKANAWLVLGDSENRLAEEILALEASEKQSQAQWQKKHKPDVSFINATTTSAVFKIAHIAEFEVGDFPTARRYYERFIRENPTEKRNFYARQALERMARTEAQIVAEFPSHP